MDAKRFGGFVAAARKERGLTQAELAQKLNVTNKAVSRWENGYGFPDISLLEPLAGALGVSLLELMHSQKTDAAGEASLTEEDAAELVHCTVEIERHNRKNQDMPTAYILLLCGMIALKVGDIFYDLRVWSGSGFWWAVFAALLIMFCINYLSKSTATPANWRIYGSFLIGGVWMLQLELGLLGAPAGDIGILLATILSDVVFLIIYQRRE